MGPTLQGRSSGPVAVVVIARDEARTVGSCLEAARRAVREAGGGDLLLVDSASRDGTAGRAVQAGVRVVRVHRASHMCPSAMRTIGTGLVHAPFVMFLDGDCELEPGFLPAALARMEAEPDLGVVAGGRRDFFRVKDEIKPAAANYYAQKRVTVPGQPAYGGCALYRSEALEKAGSFDPFLGAREEEELAHRIRLAGYRIEVMDVPMIRHITVPRESARRLLRSLRHGFFIGRGQAARVFLARGNVRSAFHGLDRVLAFLVHLLLGAACAAAYLAGISWPILAWTGVSLLALLAFLIRTRSPRRVLYYVTEWAFQGILLIVGFCSPRRDPATFRWEGEEIGPSSEDRLPRVLLVGPTPPAPLRGGVEKGVALLMDSPLARRSHMRVFNNYRPRDPNRSLMERVRYQWGKLRDFRAELRAHPVDLVHVKTSSGINFHQNALYAWAARRSGVPVLMQIHCGKFETFYRGSGSVAKAWIRRQLASASRVAVLSRAWQNTVGGLAPGARIVIVPNGLSESERRSLEEERPRCASQVLFFGTGSEELDREKGLEDLLAVIPEVTKQLPEARWVLAGLGNPQGVEETLRRELPPPQSREPRFSCLGIVTGEARAELLRGSAILAIPSYFENMPNLVLEAMSAGMGIVATEVGAVPEMLQDGKGGRLTAPGDRGALLQSLLDLLRAPELVEEMGRRNREVARRDYTMAVVQDRLEAIYLDLARWPGPKVLGGRKRRIGLTPESPEAPTARVYRPVRS